MDEIFDSGIAFQERVQSVLDFQLRNSPVYKRFAKVFGIDRPNVNTDQIPLLPIRAFRELDLITAGNRPEVIFKSSGTASDSKSRHLIANASLYKKAIENEFYRHFPKNEYLILAYTPGYSENPESSLIWMLRHLIHQDDTGQSRFLETGTPLMKCDVEEIIAEGRKVLLFGAAFGLMDLIELGSDPLPPGSAIIETGGMKTHRREITKSELRQHLQSGFEVTDDQVHSEYGMCELLSQCYAIGGEWFKTPHWVQVTIRKEGNPSVECEPGEEGKIGIIDLANIYSCPFILTEDRGVMDIHGRFRVLGRWNKNDMRGCNFLIDRD